jgi:hypothetical protein
MKRLLIAALLLFSFAHAYTPDTIRDIAANDLDGIVAPCDPLEIFAEAACFTLDSSIGLAKLQLELFATKYTDLRWLNPWTQGQGVLSRLIMFTSTTGNHFYGIFIIEKGDYNVKVAIFKIQ